MKETQYYDLVIHFGSPGAADRAIAKAFLGEIPEGCPAEWDWSQIVSMFHLPAKTLAFLIDAELKSRGVKW